MSVFFLSLCPRCESMACDMEHAQLANWIFSLFPIVVLDLLGNGLESLPRRASISPSQTTAAPSPKPKKNNKNLVVMDEPPPQKKNNKLIEPRSTQSIIDGQREKSQMVRFSQKFLDVCFQNAFARCQHTLARS